MDHVSCDDVIEVLNDVLQPLASRAQTAHVIGVKKGGKLPNRSVKEGGGMAQSSISAFYPVRRRAGEHGSLKRRKTGDSTRVDIPVLTEGADPASVPLKEPVKVVENGVKQKVGKARQRRQGVTAGKRRTRTKAAVSGAKQQDGPTLLDMIARVRATDPPPPQSSSSSSSSSSPRKRSTSSEPPAETPTKIPALSPAPPSLTSTPIRPERPATLPPSSPTPQRVETRSAALVRLAREKMAAKSSSKTLAPSASPKQARPSLEERGTSSRMAARRRLLADPPTPSQGTNRTQSQVVANLYKLSTKDLAQPTKFEEKKSRVRKTAQPPPTTPKLHEFTVFEVESPTKSKTRVPPAHERFRSLAQPSTSEEAAAAPTAAELPLPHSYQLLAEKFRCTDTVVNMLQKRKEICTFDKLKQAVQDMTRREFKQRNLAQIKTVSPSAFIFRQEKCIPGNYDIRRYEQYQLTVECDTADSETKKCLGISDLIKRRKNFHQSLTTILKRHHKAYLLSLTPPLEIPDDKIQRWHPEFHLDAVPDVAESELPQPPFKESYSSASDVLKAAAGKLSARVEQALGSVATAGGGTKAGEEEERGSGADGAVVKEEPKLNPSLNGVDKALLKKIQAREAARAVRGMTRDPLKERRLEMLSRMAELCRITRGFFIAEKKAALPWDTVATKLNDSYASGLAKDRVEEHLAYLCELVPEWATSHVIRKQKYLKINKTMDLKVVAKRLEDAKQKLLQ